mgnify:FL=1|tara:strand:+ start:172 stop:462 length:291 start_codon:yes stop_codon:yes gene_type:complete
MELQINKRGKLIFLDSYENENEIHLSHCGQLRSLKELKEDVYDAFIVAEECTNFARTHLVLAPTEDDALQFVDEYLREIENVIESHLIGVFKVNKL